MILCRRWLLLPLAAAFGLAADVRAQFGLHDDDRFYTIDCESQPSLRVKVSKANGNLQSIVVDGTELQRNPRGSHLNSGFGNGSKVAAKTFGDDRILITIESQLGPLHYYAFKKGEPNVFMATWAEDCPHPGEMRFIARLDARVLNRGNPDRPADDTSAEAIESKDIFRQRDGRTTSKYYSAVRFIDDAIHGSRGASIGAYFAIGSYESSSGGPFFRDINTQTAGDTEEVYFYMFSGHAQTEPFRRGQLHGPYALCFTKGPPPRMPAMGWMDTLELHGWISARGRVSGTARGLMRGVPYVIWLSNDTAQYWTRVDRNGGYTTPSMKPGTYTARLMRNELEVASSEVTVDTGTTRLDLSDPGPGDYLWLIGLPDGTPEGFLNAKNFDQMHPSDRRHQPWGPLTHTVRGKFQQEASTIPAVQWMGVNDGNRILFQLSRDQVKDLTLEIRTTVSHSGARPYIRVNDSWTSRLGPPPPGFRSRSITFGTWRGFNHTHEIRIPASALRAGRNSLTIHLNSGSRSGAPFLSPAVVYDSIGLRE